MDSPTQPPPASGAGAGSGSGGKIPKSRRVSAPKSPYDRPKVVPQASQSPGLFSSFILPASRKIASGAGKLISTVLGSDGSSSSSSSSGSDYGSEDDTESVNAAIDYSSQGLNMLQNNGTASVRMKSFSNESQLAAGKTETKQMIEQLIMQESFSREECNRLIEIIQSRIVDTSTKEKDAGLLNNSNTAAVMEAKKWLAKTSGSSSKFESAMGNAVKLPCVTEGDAVSPVDMAKLYMQAQPPWASPSVNLEFSKRSPVGMGSFFEETPYSSWPISRGSPSSDLWNLQDELRRVRSRAVEDLLKNPQKTSEQVLPSNSLASDSVEPSALNSPTKNKPAELVTKVDGELEAAQDGSHKDGANAFEENEAVEAVKVMKEKEAAASESTRSDNPNFMPELHDGTHDPRSPNGSGLNLHAKRDASEPNVEPPGEAQPEGLIDVRVTVEEATEASMEIQLMSSQGGEPNMQVDESAEDEGPSRKGKGGGKVEEGQLRSRRYAKRRGGKA